MLAFLPGYHAGMRKALVLIVAALPVLVALVACGGPSAAEQSYSRGLAAERVGEWVEAETAYLAAGDYGNAVVRAASLQENVIRSLHFDGVCALADYKFQDALVSFTEVKRRAPNHSGTLSIDEYIQAARSGVSQPAAKPGSNPPGFPEGGTVSCLYIEPSPYHRVGSRVPLANWWLYRWRPVPAAQR